MVQLEGLVRRAMASLAIVDLEFVRKISVTSSDLGYQFLSTGTSSNENGC